MFQRDFIFQSSMKILSTILYWKMTSFIIIFSANCILENVSDDCNGHKYNSLSVTFKTRLTFCLSRVEYKINKSKGLNMIIMIMIIYNLI